MKFFLLIISTLISAFINAQSFDVFTESRFTWDGWEREISDSTKFLILSKIEDEFIRDLEFVEDNPLNNKLDNFHFIDLDRDGDDDIVYYGFAGSESKRTLFFKNLGSDKYVKVFDKFGVIKGMEASIPGGPLSIQLKEPPCCDNRTYTLYNFLPVSTDLGVEYRASSKYAYMRGTRLPTEFFSAEKEFIVMNEKYVLRSTPIINEEKDNITAIYSAGSVGYAIAEATDETGRTWWFVVMLNNNLVDKKSFTDGDNEKVLPSRYIGWMSSRYLEER